MLNNLGLRARLSIGFGIVALLFTVITAIGVVNSAGLACQIATVVDDRFPKVVMAYDMSTKSISSRAPCATSSS